MLNHLEPPAAAPRLWSRRRILLVFLAPLAVLLLIFLLYDEGLEPAPDLVPTHPGSGAGARQNGLALLRAMWDPLPKPDSQVLWRWHDTLRGTYLWDDELVDQLNPSGRNLRKDLTDVLAAPEWVDELRTVRDFLENNSVLTTSSFAAMVASVMQKARAGDREEAISLIRDLRRLAGRQFQGSWSLDGLNEAMQWTGIAADLTCDLVAEGGFGEAELAALAHIWGAEDLKAMDFADPIAGTARLNAEIFRGDAGREFRFGYWERHGEIRPSVSMKLPQTYLGMVIQPNATMNAMHRMLRSVRDRGLAIPADRESSLFAALQKARPSGSEWSLMAHPNAGGILFLNSYVLWPAIHVDLNSRFHLFTIRAMRIWLALRRWEVASGGKLPADLTELVPGFLESIPLDPWDGSPLRWDPAGKVIFGVGTDGKPDAPVAADLNRNWTSIQMSGSHDYTSVALRYERPPPAKPPVPYPRAPAGAAKKPTP